MHPLPFPTSLKPSRCTFCNSLLSRPSTVALNFRTLSFFLTLLPPLVILFLIYIRIYTSILVCPTPLATIDRLISKMIPPFIFSSFFLLRHYLSTIPPLFTSSAGTLRVSRIFWRLCDRRWDVTSVRTVGRVPPIDPLIYPSPPPLALLAFYQLVGLVCLKSPVL